MKTNSFVAFSLFGALAVAAPYKAQLSKRDLAVVTEYSQVIETVIETATVWVEPTDSPEQAAPTTVVQTPVETPVQTPVETPAFTPVQTPVNTPQSSSVEVASSTEVASSSEVTPSSTYVAPTSTVTPSSVSTPEPSTTEAPTSTYVAPTSTSAVPTSSAVSSDSAVTAQSADSTVYTGSITHYTVGLGACGWTNTDNDPVVALSAGNMGAQSNGNEWCGKNITISYAGNEVQAYIVDKCPGCKPWSLDLSPSLFQNLAPQVDGTTDGVKWWVN